MLKSYISIFAKTREFINKFINYKKDNILIYDSVCTLFIHAIKASGHYIFKNKGALISPNGNPDFERQIKITHVCSRGNLNVILTTFD